MFKQHTQIIATLICMVVSTGAFAGEPYSVSCSKNKTNFFSASLATPQNESSQVGRVAQIYIRSPKSARFEGSISKAILNNLEKGLATKLAVVDNESNTAAVVSFGIGKYTDTDVIRSNGSMIVLDLDSGSEIESTDLSCAAVVRN